MVEALLDRLGRRGKLAIEVRDGIYDVRLVAPGPYRGRAWCTTDESDLWSHCRLGASDWHGEGRDLAGLLAECEEASRPRRSSVDDLRFDIEHRRGSRTYGPPLPSYRRWHGWRPGIERWLATSSHAYEYLGGYERHRRIEREFEAEQAGSRLRRSLPQVPARQAFGKSR